MRAVGGDEVKSTSCVSKWAKAGLRLLTSAVILWLLGIASSSQPAQAQEPGWSGPVSLSSSFPQSYLPDIAADSAGNLYVVWDALFEERDDGWGDGVGFAMWDGRAWSRPVDILTTIDHLPAIAADSKGRLHLIGLGPVGLAYSRAWAQQSPASAWAWSEPVDISGALPRVYWSDILVDSNDNIHVVFSDGAPSVNRTIRNGECVGLDCSWVFYTRSSDGGDSWSEPVKISPTLASGARVMLTQDHDDNLYVVWSTEWYYRPPLVVPSQNGFTYSLDHGANWSEPETQILDTSPSEEVPTGVDYWLSIAVDNNQTIHLVTTGGRLRHLLRQGLEDSWHEDSVPPLPEGLNHGYGFRGVAVDSSSTLHWILPTQRLEENQPAPGLFHTTWSNAGGWSGWARVTRDVRSNGCGLGNLAVSGGNRLHVVWFEHLENSAGNLFLLPRGKIEIYYSGLQTNAPPVAPVPLPPMPTPTGTAAQAESAAALTATAFLTATPMTHPITRTQDPIAQESVPATPAPRTETGSKVSRNGGGFSPLAAGIGMSALALAVAVGLSRRKRQRRRTE